MNLDEVKNKSIHFIGIGGIGMSGLARILSKNNFNITGSDSNNNIMIEVLKKEKINVFIGHNSKNIKSDCALVVISSAIEDSNPELKIALKKKIPIIKRAKLLAILSENKKTIAIAGTHGKTTTTSMVSSCMHEVNANSTDVIGGIVKNLNSNIKIGSSEYLVLEADESDGSFLYYSPLVACVTNIDNDHLDFYKNMENLNKVFSSFLEKIPFYGKAILCIDDLNIKNIIKNIKVPNFTYGFSKEAEWQAMNLENKEKGTSFDIYYKGKKQNKVNLSVFGEHNVKNALGAYLCVKYLGFDDKKIIKGLENFSGVKRRIEFLGKVKNISFYDDYAHHPTEIYNTLKALKSFFPNKKINVLFQPHRYTRTQLLYKEIAKSFHFADRIYLMPIYSAQEKEIKGVSSKLIYDETLKLGKEVFLFSKAIEIAKNLKENDIFISMGAGDVYKTGIEIKYKMENF